MSVLSLARLFAAEASEDTECIVNWCDDQWRAIRSGVLSMQFDIQSALRFFFLSEFYQDISEMLCDMLTSKFRRAFQSSADLLLAFCDRDHVSRGGRRWTSERRNLLQVIGDDFDILRKQKRLNSCPLEIFQVPCKTPCSVDEVLERNQWTFQHWALEENLAGEGSYSKATSMRF